MTRRRRSRNPQAPRPARERGPKKSDERMLATLAAERRRLIRPLVLFGVIDLLLIAAGPVCVVVPIPVVCQSFQEQVWLWFVPMLILNAFLGSLGSRLVKTIAEERRISREVKPSTS